MTPVLLSPAPATGANEGWVLDGLDLNDGANWSLESITFAPAAKRFDRVTGADSDGTRLVRPPRYEDAVVEMRLRVHQKASMLSALNALGGLTAKLQEAELLAADTGRGMPLVWTPAESGLSRTLYVKGGEVTDRPIAVQGDDAGWLVRSPVVSVTLTCDPFMYGAEVVGVGVTASTPLVEVTVAGVAGDVAAEGRIVISDNAAQPRNYVAWGLEQRAQAGRDLTLTASEMTTTGFAGALFTSTPESYSTPNVLRAELTTSPVAVCGTGNQPHVGVYRVVARIGATTAGTKVRLAWKFGDAGLARNSYVSPPAANAFCEVDLGLVTIPRAALGTQRFQAQVEAYSATPGDPFYVDYLALLPAGEGHGKALVATTFETPTTFTARDEFGQTAGALAGKTAPAGGVWAGAGDADDFTVETTGKTAERTAVGDTGVRIDYVGSSLTNAAVQADCKISTVGFGSSSSFGVAARRSATTTYVAAFIFASINVDGYQARLYVTGYVAGAEQFLVSAPVATSVAEVWFTVRLVVDSAGRYSAWAGLRGTSPSAPLILGYHSTLATGGTLAAGTCGLYDYRDVAVAATRNYDNFVAFVPTADAVVSSAQSLEVRHNDTLREDPTGTYWGRPQTYRGSRFYLPAAGDDNLTSRVAVMARRNNIEETSVANVTDSTTVSVAHTPRWLVAPRS